MNKNNENGFSLIELAVAMAIMVALGSIGFNVMNAAADGIVEKQIDARQAQEDAFNSLINSVN
jgi:prepilin-type N-terminal cleavage/methylation domain-containing protein